MTLQVKISARAAAEIKRAAEWWRANRPAHLPPSGQTLLTPLRFWRSNRGLAPKYEGARVPGVRRLFLSRVSDFIYYTADATDLKFLAFWHSSR